MTNHFCLCLAACLALVPAAADAQPASGPARVPLREGLAIVRAYRNAAGDFEAIATVTRADATGITIAASTDETADTCRNREGGRSAGLRTVLREDLENAHAFRQEFTACVSAPEVHPGSTAIGVSAGVVRELHASGQSALSATTTVAGLVPGTLTRVEAGTVPITVIVNDEPTVLAAIHVRWQSRVGAREYWILDDAANPLVLRGSYNGTPFLEVVKVSYPVDQAPTSARMARTLSTGGRAVVYGIFFDFASDRLKNESNATLTDIARVLQQNPSWSLAVEGHTDNLGGDADNVDLSKRRAAAVKQALVVRYKVDANRLRADGYGSTKPKDSNETIVGRARNRRVELVKIG